MGVIWRRKIHGRLTITSLSLALLLGLIASHAFAQDDPNTLSREVAEQTISFPAVNPYTKASGSMTITFSGVLRATRLNEPTGLAVSRITGRQRGTFSFVPDDPSQPTISGSFRFRLSGKPQPKTDMIHFAFRMNGRAPDGSVVRFVQNERVAVIEERFDISFGDTDGVGLAKDH